MQERNRISHGKVELRAIEPEDLDLIYEWENDISLWHLSNTRIPFSRHVLSQYLTEASGDVYEQKQVRLIIQTLDARAVGAVDLYDIDFFHQRAGVGILIHQSGDRHLGYASDALSALEQYALETLGLRQLFAVIPEDNTASIRLFEKSGYSLTGIRKQWLNTITGWRDEWFYQKILVPGKN
jgi:diamine N-acetyltransferase